MTGVHLRRTAALALALAFACLLTAGSAQAAATLVVVNRDGPGEGFNDATPWTPTGGNPATTLGQARLNAFQYAADLWGDLVQSGVPIRVEATMDPLTCTSTSAVLGQAGTNSVHRGFVGALLPNTWYPQALANALAGTDLNPTSGDIGATFNSAINGGAGCLGGASWYYGFDANPPAGDIDFVTVVMHEIGHGLGFQTFVDLTTGTKLDGRNDMFMVHIERAGAVPADYPTMNDAQRVAAAGSDPDLLWTGTAASYMANQLPLTAGNNGEHVRLHGPATLQPGSSVSHWSTAVSPDEVMEPVLTGPVHDPGLAKFLLLDIGWPMDATVGVVWRGLRATVAGGSVQLDWRCEANEPLAGFRVYRAQAGKAGDELVSGEHALDRSAGTFVDRRPPAGASLLYTVAAVRPDGSEIRSPQVAATVAAVTLALAQNRPNPFNAATEVDFVLDRDAAVRLRVHDAAGRLVRTLIDEVRPAGSHTAFWDGRDQGGRGVASGSYVCRLEAGASVRVVRMTLLK
ncbi:MAG: FlgD immunoglobulin-like domain containing protein [Candidatus Krumholzibacteriia bacterium]